MQKANNNNLSVKFDFKKLPVIVEKEQGSPFPPSRKSCVIGSRKVSLTHSYEIIVEISPRET